MPAWTYADRIGAIPVISLKKEWMWCIFNITPLTMAPVILALSHPHAAHRWPSPFYKLGMSARRGKTLPNWTKKGDLGKERKTWGILRQWGNSSANTAGIGKLYSPLFWERLSIYTPVLWKVFLRPPSIHRKKYLSMKPLNALLRFLPPFYQSLGKQSAVSRGRTRLWFAERPFHPVAGLPKSPRSAQSCQAMTESISKAST